MPPQRFGVLAYAFAEIAAGVVAAAHQQDGQALGDLRHPPERLQFNVKPQKVAGEFHAGLPAAERVVRVVLQDARIHRDPLAFRRCVLAEAVQHAVEEGIEPAPVRVVGVIRQIRQKARVAEDDFSPRQIRHEARQQQAFQIFADLRRHVPRQHGAPALAQDEQRHAGLLALHAFEQRQFVFRIVFEIRRAGVAHAAGQKAGLAVADVIVRVHRDAGFRESQSHVQIAAGMLAVTVDQLDARLRGAQRGHAPAPDGIDTVRGRKL